MTQVRTGTLLYVIHASGCRYLSSWFCQSAHKNQGPQSSWLVSWTRQRENDAVFLPQLLLLLLLV